MSKGYNLYLSSSDKISGTTNNNASFNINFDSFLPRDYDSYEITFSFQTAAGYYKDVGNTSVYSNAKIILDFSGRSYSYDSSNNGNSFILGYATRDASTSASNTNTYNCFYAYNPPKTINRPTQNNINVKIYNMANNTLLTDAGTTTPFLATSNTNTLTLSANQLVTLPINTVISGNGVTNGTTITAQTGAYVYTTSAANTIAAATPMTATYGSSNDMTAWTMAIRFIPIENSKIHNSKTDG